MDSIELGNEKLHLMLGFDEHGALTLLWEPVPHTIFDPEPKVDGSLFDMSRFGDTDDDEPEVAGE